MEDNQSNIAVSDVHDLKIDVSAIQDVAKNHQVRIRIKTYFLFINYGFYI